MNQSGSALILALFISAILSVVTLLSITQISALNSNRSNYIKVLLAGQQIDRELALDPGSNLCSGLISEQSTQSSYRNINYNVLFANKTSCTVSHTQPDSSSSFQRNRLSGSSNVTPTTCCDSLNRVREAAVYLENLSLTEAELESDLLASAGYLEIEKLKLNYAKTNIVAAGDVIINELGSVHLSPVHLVIVSATGRIEIKKITGDIQIFASNPAGVIVPSGSSVYELKAGDSISYPLGMKQDC